MSHSSTDTATFPLPSLDNLATIPALNVLIVGASRGIGCGFVRALLTLPTVTTIFATYRQPQAATELLEQKEVGSDRLVPIPMDITDEAQIIAGLDTIKTHLKTSSPSNQLHLVINCVGFLHDATTQPEKSLRQIKADQLTHYFQVNSIGPIVLTKHLVPLLKGGDRSIYATISAKIGSIGDNYLGGWYGYRASKAALNMFMRTAAIEYGRKSPKTIIVTLHPGTTNTRLSKPFQRNVPPDKLFPVEKTVELLLQVMGQLKQEDSGHFFSWDGSQLPW